MKILFIIIFFSLVRLLFYIIEYWLRKVPYNKINRTIIPDWKYPIPPAPAKVKNDSCK